MPASLVLAIAYAGVAPDRGDPLSWLAVPWLALALATTLAVNVRINAATGTWNAEHPPANWRTVRARWERFQAMRSWLLLAGFLLICAALAWRG
jgi:hypothetical protein